MKKWNAPEVVELNINETASGWSNSGKENTWVDDDDHAHGVHGGGNKDKPYSPTPPPEPDKPSTPDTLS